MISEADHSDDLPDGERFEEAFSLPEGSSNEVIFDDLGILFSKRRDQLDKPTSLLVEQGALSCHAPLLPFAVGEGNRQVIFDHLMFYVSKRRSEADFPFPLLIEQGASRVLAPKLLFPVGEETEGDKAQGFFETLQLEHSRSRKRPEGDDAPRWVHTLLTEQGGDPVDISLSGDKWGDEVEPHEVRRGVIFARQKSMMRKVASLLTPQGGRAVMLDRGRDFHEIPVWGQTRRWEVSEIFTRKGGRATPTLLIKQGGLATLWIAPR